MKEEYHMALTALGKRICVILASIGSGKTFCPVGPLTKAHRVPINFRLSQKFQKITPIYGGTLKSKNYIKLFLKFSIFLAILKLITVWNSKLSDFGP